MSTIPLVASSRVERIHRIIIIQYSKVGLSTMYGRDDAGQRQQDAPSIKP